MKIKMKNYILLIGAAFLFTTAAYADTASTVDDVTSLGTLSPGQSKSKTFNLVKGKNTITVFSDDDDAVFTCKFINDSGVEGLIQEKVPNCNGIVTVNAPMIVGLSFTNNTDKTIDYRVTYHHDDVVSKKSGKHK